MTVTPLPSRRELREQQQLQPYWPAPADSDPQEAAAEGGRVVLTFTSTSAQPVVLLNVTLDDLQRVLDAARPQIDRHRAMRDSLSAGSFESAIAHGIITAYDRIRDAANQAELSR